MKQCLQLILICCAIGVVSSDSPEAIERSALAAFLGETVFPGAEWRRYEGKEFTLFYCTMKAARTGAAGIYLGATPSVPEANDANTLEAGALGRFSVTWLKRITPAGTTRQEAMIKLGPKEFARVLAEAPTQAEVDATLPISLGCQSSHPQPSRPTLAQGSSIRS